MAAVPFDTLKLARRLESAGFPPQQAGSAAEAIAEAMTELATKADLANEIAELRTELKADIADTKSEIALPRRDIEILRRDLASRLGGIIVVTVGVLLAAIRYMLPLHS